MECQPQNPEFRKNPENFHRCYMGLGTYDIGEQQLLHTHSLTRAFTSGIHKVCM